MTELEQYLLGQVKKRDKQTLSLEAYARENRVPIIDPISSNFLMQLVRIKKPANILEIGTAIGYSALRMNEAYPYAMITTIERNDQLYNKAIKNIRQFNKEQNIDVIHGDALTILNDLANSDNIPIFDLVFIDAAKAQYKRFFKLVKPLIAEDGIIISDNVLFKGLVINNQDEPQSRLAQLANKINSYNQWLSQLEDFSTSIVPIGDGIAISVRI